MAEMRVLVIDDEESIVGICRVALQRLGMDVETSTTAADALKKFQESDFDLVIVDWVLPDASGLSLFQAMREHRPQLLGILITGQSVPETAQEALEAGFWAYLPKPFTVTELRGIVERAAAYVKAIREQERLTLMVSLSEIAMQIAHSLELDEVLQGILQVAYQQTQADKVSLMVVDASVSPPRLRIIAAQGLPKDLLSVEVPIGEGIAGQVAQTGEPLLVNTRTIQYLQAMPLRYQGAGSALCLPLKVGHRVVGVLNLTRLKAERPFTESDIRLYLVLAAQAALVIENAQLHQRLREGHLAALASFARYAESMEPYRQGHAERVSASAKLLGEKAGLSRKEAEQLRVAGLAYDLGLLWVPKEILNKLSPLTEREWDIVRQHPLWSLELVERQALLTEDVAKAVLHHHERFDGTGYPHGLKGEQIPFGARLLAIADTFDAITHDRPYRPAYPKEQAVAEMRHIAGTHLDPALTDLFLTEVLPKVSDGNSGRCSGA